MQWTFKVFAFPIILYVGLGKRRCYSRAHGIQKLSWKGFCSVNPVLPSLHRCAVRATLLLFVICVSKSMLGNCDPLSCWLGNYIMCVLRGVCVSVAFLPFLPIASCRQLWDEASFTLWLPFPALSWLSWMHGIWAYISVLSQSQELTGERGMVWSCIVNNSHISKLYFEIIQQ